MKTRIGTSAEFPEPEIDLGWSVWIEQGVWFKAPTVSPFEFGPHDYAKAGRHWLGNCRCGCEMNQSSSSGPVDPFGPCPLNPFAQI